MNTIVKQYDFFKTKYGDELLIDLIRLESLEKYIREKCPHSLTYYDITLITGGKGYFSIDDNRYPIESGNLFLSSPGQIRYWDANILPTGYVLIFEDRFLSNFLGDYQFVKDLKCFNVHSSPPQIMLLEPDVAYLTPLMQNIEQEVKTFKTTDKHILRALLYHVLIWINRKYLNAYPSTHRDDFNRYIKKYINLVEQNFSSNHSVSYYADVLNITAGHLNDLCKSHLGVSAKDYIQNRITTEAKRLLLYSDLQVNEIALKLNFEEPSYFIRRFKKITGTTPLSFRQNRNLE